MTSDAALAKMRAAGVGEVAVRTFADQLARLRAGETGTLPEADLEPVADLPDADALPAGEAPLDEVVVLKLNGGLGTSMGMTGPKSLLQVKDGRSFLDITLAQVEALRARTGARLPLVLMNSFATAAPTREAVGDRAVDFLQNKVPKLDATTLEPVSWPADPAKEWAPPGHGDLYAALQTSGLLDRLLAEGFRHAFVSNADNLGATLDERILAWFAGEGTPFLMEVADRTEVDRKGGHLARRRDGGGLVLREVAQTPEDDLAAFQDVGRHRFFNTNNLWVDLRALADAVAGRGGVLPLPMIVNRKTVDPADRRSPAVVQLETAMGAAIDVIPGAQAVRVPRVRFAPVKTTNDLLALRSDAYVLRDGAFVELADGRTAPPAVDLDPEHHKLVPDLDARFPAGPPSLREAVRLVVRGHVTFGAGVVVRGSAQVSGVDRVEDGAVLGDA